LLRKAGMEPEVVPSESISGLIKGILKDIRSLIEEEFALARLEIHEQTTRAKTAAVSLGVAAVALLFGGVFLLVAAAIGIADVLDWPTWTGFLVVAVLMSLIGAVTLASGRRKLSAVQVKPERTLATLKENAEWISKRLSSAQK
jgi:uncharacterized membrane protein YqjE